MLFRSQHSNKTSPENNKGKWTPEEDAYLRKLVAQYGDVHHWTRISHLMPQRNTKQCRERWCKHLDDRLKHGCWTRDEDNAILELREQGMGWAEISRHLEGRTDNTVKIRWNSLVRMQRRLAKRAAKEEQLRRKKLKQLKAAGTGGIGHAAVTAAAAAAAAASIRARMATKARPTAAGKGVPLKKTPVMPSRKRGVKTSPTLTGAGGGGGAASASTPGPWAAPANSNKTRTTHHHNAGDAASRMAPLRLDFTPLKAEAEEATAATDVATATGPQKRPPAQQQMQMRRRLSDTAQGKGKGAHLLPLKYANVAGTDAASRTAPGVSPDGVISAASLLCASSVKQQHQHQQHSMKIEAAAIAAAAAAAAAQVPKRLVLTTGANRKTPMHMHTVSGISSSSSTTPPTTAANKGKWLPEEDALLQELVQQYGREWSYIANCIQGRNVKQCRERWCKHLDPTLRHGSWSEDEDKIILRGRQNMMGWAEIARKLNGRTDNKVKIRFNSLIRAQDRRAREKAAKFRVRCGGKPHSNDSGSSSSNNNNNNNNTGGVIVGGGGGRRAAAARQRPRPHGGVLSPTSVLAGGSTTATN